LVHALKSTLPELLIWASPILPKWIDLRHYCKKQPCIDHKLNILKRCVIVSSSTLFLHSHRNTGLFDFSQLQKYFKQYFSHFICNQKNRFFFLFF
jgi:hypothetical protein